MDAMQKLLDKIGKENRAAEAKTKPPTEKQVQSDADFLQRWSKGKPIVRVSADSTMWKSGKYMTKITSVMVDAIVAAGLGTLTGKSTDARAKLIMKRS